MLRTLAAIEEQYGGVASYLLAIGVPQAHLDAVRAAIRDEPEEQFVAPARREGRATSFVHLTDLHIQPTADDRFFGQIDMMATLHDTLALLRERGILPGRRSSSAAASSTMVSRRVTPGCAPPYLRGPLAALGILLFISHWNEYFWPLLVTNKPENTVMQVGLQFFLTQEGSQWGPLMAASSLASLPIFALYLALQRQVIDAFVRSGLK